MRCGWLWLIVGLVACKGTGGPEDALAFELSIDPMELEFGTVPQGGSATLAITIRNAGPGDAELLSVIVSQGDRDSWTVAWDRNPLLAAGSTKDIELTFHPMEAGELYGAIVHVRTNAPEASGLFIHAIGTSGLSEADEDGDGSTVAGGDCNDADPHVRPGAPERCNGTDDDCDGDVPANESDDDGDGVRICAGDCDDSNSARGPGFLEICDNIDNDCDGIESDDTDQDGDGLSICDGDCDDGAAGAAPGLPEVCGSGRDNDCDGAVDSADSDADGHDRCGQAPDCDDADATVFPRVVSNGGDDSGAGSFDHPLASLQQAMDSVAGCPIWLEAGTHEGGATTSSVHIRGLDSGVVIDGAGQRALDLVDGSLRELTVSGGAAANGAGLRVLGGSVALNDVEFRDNVATASGGAIAVQDGELLVFGDSVFEGNSAVNGGAIAADNALVVDGGTTLFTGNEAEDGAGIYGVDSTLLISGSRFVGNTASVRGGGLSILRGGGHLVQNNRFVNNDAAEDGGGVLLDDGGSGTVSNNRFQSNDAGQGGGIWLDQARMSVVNNTLLDNDAVDGAAVRHVSGLSAIHNNLAHFNTGNGAFHTDDATLVGSYNTAFGTAGEDWVGPWLTLGTDNRTENPGFFNFTDDGDPDNDVLILQPTSPSVDSGSPDHAFDDTDGTRNDRGYTGGPGAL